MPVLSSFPQLYIRLVTDEELMRAVLYAYAIGVHLKGISYHHALELATYQQCR